jgi:hypothetical protein
MGWTHLTKTFNGLNRWMEKGRAAVVIFRFSSLLKWFRRVRVEQV